MIRPTGHSTSSAGRDAYDASAGHVCPFCGLTREITADFDPASPCPRCTLSDKFLIVRGDLRTYKIHLGSGNILMEPNDQYLCIVLDRSHHPERTVLPFEGDGTLALVLSKAFLLAEDTKITDRQIRSQIGR